MDEIGEILQKMLKHLGYFEIFSSEFERLKLDIGIMVTLNNRRILQEKVSQSSQLK